ncbi:DUF4430 domain-containing protein [Methanosarcina sp. KYL-1]|uniref:fasciclin domain-containing protein n=1 Tax=Methanosarcina sp. KYL-1 TaxID=2602068 RepID=UPI0021014509|nr:fasciclin domain-containing protein [Methanosarcina sp. KYL-1]MCQ1534879.1 DUF4430 domain-containing protein [Methanosarcina sp. KYL-1]
MVSCAAAWALEEDAQKNVAEIAAGDENFSKLTEALNVTGLNSTLSEEGPYTVFAPTNEAFEALPEGTLEALLNDTETLSGILLNHVVEGNLTEENLSNQTNVTTIQGTTFPITVTETGLMVGDANLTETDIFANNGVIHVIDAVLLPPEEGPEELYNDTVTLIPGNFTFVPSNNATASYEIDNFTDLGALVATGLDFKVSEMGKMAGNGNGNMTEKSLILESIDGIQNDNATQEKWFILINGETAPEDIGMNPVLAGDNVSFLYALEEGGEPVLEEAKFVVNILVAEEAAVPDIIDTAEADGNFTALLAALDAANLTDTLREEGPYTVFAPTDDAFEALPNETIDAIVNDPNMLTNILLYHVAPGELMEADVVNLTSITTLQGSLLPVNVTEEGIFVGNAKIIQSDIETSNGVIHVIDAVLTLPEEEGAEVLFDDNVTLTPGNFTFVPSNNATASYEIDNFTDLGALYASELSFNASDEAFESTGGFLLESIDGFENSPETFEAWYIFINGEQAPEAFGLNTVAAGDTVSFWYTLEEGGEPVLEETKYLVNITVAEEPIPPEEPPVELVDIIETANETGNFTALLGAIETANLTETLKGEGPYTVFAPTDDAFAALPNETVEALQNDTVLKDILLYHVAEGKLMEADLQNVTNVTTLQGSNLTVNATEEGIFVGDAKIIIADIETSNGVIHAIDAVLIPPEAPPEEMDIIDTAEAYGNFTALLEALETANLTETLRGEGPYTVFAPTDDAFAALPNETIAALQNDTEMLTEILLYHVAEEKLMEVDLQNVTNVTTLQGSNQTVNVTEEGIFIGDAKIIVADIEASNGVIHAIDAVLIPPEEPPVELVDIIETANETGNFTALLGAIETANLTETLKGEGPYTVFAPTDDAFAALPNETVEALQNDTVLKDILLYHVAEGKLMEADLQNVTNVTTLQGSNLTVNATEEGIFVGDAKIIIADIETSNGVIHAIDAVLIPPEAPPEEMDIIDTAEAYGNFTALLEALETANLTETLRGEGPYTVFAPTDDAFAALPNETIAALQNDTEMLTEILLYHVAEEKLMEVDLQNVTNVTTLQGSNQTVNVTEEGIFIGDAKIIVADIEASNGVIHAIDAVLIPPEEPPTTWYFFSIPFEAEDTSVDSLLAGVDFNALIYYNSSSMLYEDVLYIEPLKGYWINIPPETEFNASEQFSSAAKKVAAVPPSMKLYPGWNAVGSPSEYNLTADTTFITINDSYVKVIGPWVPDETGYGSYAFVGYNGLTGELNGNQVGTDIFEVKPYDGYWVYVKEETVLA